MTLLDDLRAEGLNVETWPGWETHAAPKPSYVSKFDPVGVLIHWDAVKGFNLNTYFMNPRFDQPTYHVAIEKDGHVWLGSQGYVYGAGGGDAAVYQAMKADRVPPPAAVEKNMNGNPHFYAVCLNYYPGPKGSPGPAIPGPQYESAVKVHAAFCRRVGWNPLYRVNDHDGWTTRKDDLSGSPPGNWWAPPSNWDLTRFRNDVRRQLEDGMAFTAKEEHELKAFVAEVLKAGSNMGFIPYLIEEIRAGIANDSEVVALRSEVAKLRARIDGLQLKVASGLPAEEVVKIVRDL